MSLLQNLPHLLDQYRTSNANDSLGAPVETDVAVATDVSCWVQNASAREVMEFQKADQRVTHKVLFAVDPSVRVDDTLIPSSGPFTGKELTVRAFVERTAGLGWMWVAYCEEERNEQPSSWA